MKETRKQKKGKIRKEEKYIKRPREPLGPEMERGPRPIPEFHPNRYAAFLLPLADKWAQDVSRLQPPSGDHAVTVSPAVNFSLLNSRLNARQFLPPHHAYE
jgi:hypothetical protein